LKHQSNGLTRKKKKKTVQTEIISCVKHNHYMYSNNIFYWKISFYLKFYNKYINIYRRKLHDMTL